MKRTKCGYCLQNVVPFLDLGETPLADAYPSRVDEVETFYPLGLCVCERCKLVQLTYVVNDEELYGRDYGFYTGASASHLEYWQRYARYTAAWFQDLPPSALVVEVACNDGTLLSELNRELSRNGTVRVLGVDPARGPAAQAQGKGLTVMVEPFNSSLAQRIREEHGPAHLVVANNVLAHVSDVEDFIRGVVHLLDRDGVAIFEVQYLADLLTGNMFDHVYHEHRSFFTLRTLQRCTLALGLRIFNVEHHIAQGGSIRVYLTKGSSKFPVLSRVDTFLAREAWTEDWGIFDQFQGRVDHIKYRLWDVLEHEIPSDHTIAGYAASAKSATLLNYCGIDRGWLRYVEDTTPTKIGKFTPGTKIPIVARGDCAIADTYLLLAWNYAPAILRRFLSEHPQPSTRWIVPIPQPVVF